MTSKYLRKINELYFSDYVQCLSSGTECPSSGTEVKGTIKIKYLHRYLLTECLEETGLLPVTRYFLNPFREESDESSMFINVHLVRRDNRIGTWKRSFRTFMYNTQACLKIQLFQNPTGATFGENENKNSKIIYTLKKKKKSLNSLIS